MRLPRPERAPGANAGSHRVHRGARVQRGPRGRRVAAAGLRGSEARRSSEARRRLEARRAVARAGARRLARGRLRWAAGGHLPALDAACAQLEARRDLQAEVQHEERREAERARYEEHEERLDRPLAAAAVGDPEDGLQDRARPRHRAGDEAGATRVIDELAPMRISQTPAQRHRESNVDRADSQQRHDPADEEGPDEAEARAAAQPARIGEGPRVLQRGLVPTDGPPQALLPHGGAAHRRELA
mmetsp:Transcript_38646/g.116806  ORF Transcript_38646/g.116806 Transcript_38646/m.116806 type:complete len:244 (-) Transcript_38646:718-1449(-)